MADSTPDTSESRALSGGVAAGVPTRHWSTYLASRGALKRLGVLGGVLLLVMAGVYFVMVRMPGESFRGALPPMTSVQSEAAARLRGDVERIAGTIGQRSTYNAKSLAETAMTLKKSLEGMGYTVVDHSFASRGAASPNMQVEIPGMEAGLRSQIILVGAHYDAFQGTPGADDNASGVAVVLEMARRFAGRPSACTLRLVLFVNEEPPAFQTSDMGSLIYARQAAASGDNIVAMVSLESLAAGSQKYPPPLGWFYPTTGDFLAFVGNVNSRALVRRCIGVFRERCEFPSEGLAAPDSIPGVGWSDHWAFWQTGVEAIMITGTATFRNPNYHEGSDTPGTLDYDSLARATDGIEAVIRDLVERGK